MIFLPEQWLLYILHFPMLGGWNLNRIHILMLYIIFDVTKWGGSKEVVVYCVDNIIGIVVYYFFCFPLLWELTPYFFSFPLPLFFLLLLCFTYYIFSVAVVFGLWILCSLVGFLRMDVFLGIGFLKDSYTVCVYRGLITGILCTSWRLL